MATPYGIIVTEFSGNRGRKGTVNWSGAEAMGATLPILWKEYVAQQAELYGVPRSLTITRAKRAESTKQLVAKLDTSVAMFGCLVVSPCGYVAADVAA